MKLEDIKKYFADNQDQAEVKSYLEELSAVSSDKVKGFLETDEGKRVLQPHLDKHFTKGLESWKQNNLDKIVEEEVSKRNPQKSPAELEVEKLRKEIEEERKARNRESLVNKALKVADEKQLPKDVIDFFIADDEENTLANLSKLEEVYSKAVQTAVDSKFKEKGRDIEQGSFGKTGAIDINQLAQAASIRN